MYRSKQDSCENQDSIAKSTCVLHLAGSVESEFLHNLSLLYCEGAWNALTEEYPHSLLAVVAPDRTWRITSNKFQGLASAEVRTEKDALAWLSRSGVDAVVPHMFCTEGMTTYRAHMEALGLRLLGNPSHVCAIAHHKEQTKSILREAGVRVPGGLFITRRADAPAHIPFCPCVVKAADLDNSVGVSFCDSQEAYAHALDTVFDLSSQVLIEEYMPGEEIRCGVVVMPDGELRALPMIKYILQGPIRTAENKLLTTGSTIDAWGTKESQTELPARMDAATRLKVETMAKEAHKALGCEVYSLFDFRVNDKEAAILEACLFCSFSPKSCLSTMARAEGTSPLEFFRSLLEVRLKQA